MTIILSALVVFISVVSFLLGFRIATKGAYIMGARDEQVFMLIALKKTLKEEDLNEVYQAYKRLDVELKIKGQQ